MLVAVVSLRATGNDGAGRGKTVLRVAPERAGAADGSSWSDAAPLSALPDLVSELPAGGEVWLRADEGPYDVEESLKLRAGGADGDPVVVRGVDEDGDPEPAVLRAGRASPYSPDGEPGGDVFSLRGGADHLVFRDLAFQDVGNAFIAAGDVRDITVTAVEATNVRRFFENDVADDEQSADLRGLVVRDVSVKGFSKRFLRLRYASSDVLVEDVEADSERQDGDDFAIGVHLEDEVSDVVLRRVRMDNTRDTLREYWNGDGFATEREVSGVQLIDTTANGHTDAGYDLKSRRTTLTGATATGNKRNFRFWADDTTAEDCTGTDPVKRGGNGTQAQVWMGEGAAVEMVDCTLTDSSPDTVVFDLENDASLTLTGGGEVQHEGELRRLSNGATLELPES
ncbi:MAG: hypothetical protein AVDCRST_MAG07-577 [uncultured Frankineae bacterium]|uniref:Right handed beta helix domain-containing protein n=1 Tax=uncultured Frankineae bacterium TaxID=437475 RepID=A0A6J4KNK1_9ACTN|nr:MAG: hypothetical protein AVDCRST_MAG07-577 [uncultured Frankineae bacterium]